VKLTSNALQQCARLMQSVIAGPVARF